MKKLVKRKNILKEAGVLLIALVMVLSAVVVAQSLPDKPSQPSGPTEGDANVGYTFCTSTTDADGDDIYYKFDWDDGTNSGWLGLYPSGAEASTSHTWSAAGTYCIKVKAWDDNDGESDWSDPLCVNIVATSPPCDIQIGNIYIGTGPGVDKEKIKADIINTGGATTLTYTMTFTFTSGSIYTQGATGPWTSHTTSPAVITGSLSIGDTTTEHIWIKVKGTACFELKVEADCADPKTVNGCAGLAICS